MKKGILSFLFLTAFLVLMMAGFVSLPDYHNNASLFAKDADIKVMINNAASQIKPLKSGDVYYVPLNFPLEEGKNTWQVTVEYDKTKNTVNVQKTLNKQKLRGDTICPRCGGNGRCQACYPPGSGRNISGNGSCSACDGSGKCFYCNGNGSY